MSPLRILKLMLIFTFNSCHAKHIFQNCVLMGQFFDNSIWYQATVLTQRWASPTLMNAQVHVWYITNIDINKVWVAVRVWGETCLYLKKEKKKNQNHPMSQNLILPSSIKGGFQQKKTQILFCLSVEKKQQSVFHHPHKSATSGDWCSQIRCMWNTGSGKWTHQLMTSCF